MTAPVRRRRPGPRRALTEDEILDAALSLLDDGGANAASVRGIAAKVGVAPNAVYTYFPDKAAVFKALVERLLGEVDHDVFADREPALAPTRGSAGPGTAGRGWRRTRPSVPLMIGGPMDGPHALALNERLLELLADAGLNPADAARAAYLLIVYVFGSIALEVADAAQASPLPPESERIAGRRRAVAATPAEHYPRIAAQRPTHRRLHLHRAVPLGTSPHTRRHHHQHDTPPGLTRVMPRARDSNSRPNPLHQRGGGKGLAHPSSTRPHIKGYGVPA